MMQHVQTAGTQGVCPRGFDPTKDEWKTLEAHLGMLEVEAGRVGFRGTDQGSQLAGIKALWSNGILDQNLGFGSSGFDAPLRKNIHSVVHQSILQGLLLIVQ